MVLKLAGVDDADGAARMRGQLVLAAAEDAPELPEDTYYVSRLVGSTVVEVGGRELGTVRDVVPRAEQDLLVVGEGEDELLIPMTAEIVVEVEEGDGTAGNGRLTVRLPEGLAELNEPRAEG